MRRWDGWGVEDAHVPTLAGEARRHLRRELGDGRAPSRARLEDLVAAVPASRLPRHDAVSTDAEDRVRHARGQSFPDLLALRSGRFPAVPDGIARPADAAEVRSLLDLARSVGASVIPYGGGTSVVGGVSVMPSERPTLTLDLSALAGMRAFDAVSGLVTVGPGTTGPALETALAGTGFTVGHEPQSWELATAGGWVAARGAGLRSLGVGRIEALFAGGTLEAPAGTFTMPPHPASAAGPDLRQLVLGSEGRLGVLTDVILRATPRPELDVVDAYALPGWAAGLEAARTLAQVRPGLTSVRLSTPDETAATLAFAGAGARARALRLLLRARRVPGAWALLLVGAAGPPRTASAARREARAIVGRHGGVGVPGIAARWRRTRFAAPYLRDTLWAEGYGADTLETATDWSTLPRLTDAVLGALRDGLADEGERVHAFAHLSHLYPSGSSLYVTYLFRLAADPDATLRRWSTLKAAASRAIVEHGATISHHHGVGRDHAPDLAAEKGELGMAALAAVARTFDPDGLMVPGVLLAEPAR